MRPPPAPWSGTAKLLHWAMAVLLAGQFGLGVAMTGDGLEAGEKFDLYQTHKSFGLVALALALVRLAWRLSHPAPGWPAAMPGWERLAARAMHGALYALMLALPLLGWVMVSAAPLPVPTRLFDLVPVPHLMGIDTAVYAFVRHAHALAAWLLAALVVVHAAAAMKHHLVDRDAVLARMLPSRRVS